MPCNTIQTTNVVFSIQNTDFALLKLAMQAVGFSSPEANYRGDLSFYRGVERAVFVDGKISLTLEASKSKDSEVCAIKRAYSTQVVYSQAKKYGWKLRETEPGKYVVQK
jgi:hypothetical protein